jgi:hypothetical protein
MTYVDRLYRCNIVASIPGGEQIVNTVWMRKASFVFQDTDAQEIGDQVRNAWAALITAGSGGFTTGLAVFMGTDVQWTGVSTYRVNELGRSTQQAESPFAANVKGSAGSMLPPQLAVCVTLLTNRPGRSGRGRLFLGGISTGLLTPQGRLTVANRDGISARMAAFYKAVRDTPNNPDVARPVVVSPTATDANNITKVSVGDVPDTIRSRRNKLVEQRVTTLVN